jgi:hypothetical protein
VRQRGARPARCAGRVRGPRAGRPSSSVVISATRQSTPASSKIARANSAHVHSPSAATCQIAVRQLEQLRVASRGGRRRSGSRAGRRRRDLVALCAEPQHRPHEVRAGPAEEPRAADDPAVATSRSPSSFVRRTTESGAARPTRRTARASSVEDVVGREVDDGAPSAATLRVPSTFDAPRPRVASAPSTSVQAAACRTTVGLPTAAVDVQLRARRARRLRKASASARRAGRRRR